MAEQMVDRKQPPDVEDFGHQFDELVKRVNHGRLRAQRSDEFLTSVVEEVAKFLDAQVGFINRVHGDRLLARTTTLYSRKPDVDAFAYEVVGTPCEIVLNTRETFIQLHDITEAFPDDHDLEVLQADGYAGAPLIGHNGAFMGLFSFVFRGPRVSSEMTERVLRHFAPLVAAEVERNLASERMTIALEGTGTGLWDWDIATNEVVFDDFCREMLGYDHDELPNKDGFWLDLTHPVDSKRAHEEIRNHVIEQTPFDLKVRLRHKAGFYRWYRARAETMRDEDGRAVRMLGTITDIDDLEMVTRQAMAANQAKSVFLANMSHEIRTPMNAVMGMLQILGTSEVTPEQKEWIDIAYGSAESLLTILNDILDLSRLEAGKVDIQMATVNVCSIVEEIVRAMQPQARKKGLSVAMTCGCAASYHGRTDANRLRQILNNFIGNAVKFTDNGSVTIAVQTASPGMLRISVIDTGPGIDPETVARLFHRFEQGDPSMTRKFGGTGLGLAICRELATRMDARVGVSSTPGAGSTFWIDLPAAAEQNAA